MSQRNVVRMVFLLSIFTAAALSAQNGNFLLRSEGNVSVNGTVVPSSALVSPGDVVQTGKGGSAKLVAPGVAMVLGENSRVSVANGKLALDQGSASVTNSGRIATLFSQYSVKPAGSGSATYLVSNKAGSLSVTSANGALAVVGPDLVAKNLLSGQKANFTSAKTSLVSAGDDASSQPDSFNQLIGAYSSNLCRTAKSCYCKTAARCPAH